MTVHLRLDGLRELDPLEMPLPHGTEVTTRVDRVVDGRNVPQGAVGRIVGSEADSVRVLVVGVGVVSYARREVLPRKAGQARWALRRAAAWDALRGHAVLEATVGSHAWGLAGEASDTDLRGVFVLPFPWTTGLVEPPQELVSPDGSATFWECGRALALGLRADPNLIETLFVGGARPLDAMGEWILEARDAFVSAEIYGSFGRYALSQLRRLEQSLRLAEHRGDVLEWLRAEPVPSLDEVARRLARTAGHLGDDAVDRAREYLKQLYRSLHAQGLLPAQDFASLVRFARERQPDLDLPRTLRPKNAYNLLRLIWTAIDWLRTGVAELEVHGARRERLLAIKRGEVPLDEVLREAEASTAHLEAARQSTRLPALPDLPRVDGLLARLQEEAARRWLSGAPGPWGREAPGRPLPETPRAR